MSFVETLNRIDRDGWRSPLLAKFERMLQPAGPAELESLAARSAALTRRHFGRTMRLFAPLYLSNECVNNCAYCGFSRDNSIFRVTLTVDQVVREARHLAGQGFRNVLLVAGEHPKFVSEGYLQDCIDAIKPFIPTIGIEVGPMEDDQYAEIVQHGAEGLVVYQETYDRPVYQTLHTAGPKKNFDWRLDCPERAYAGGFRRVGIGALMGLADWRYEALRLAAHLEYLYRHGWKATYTVSLPRLRPAAGEFQPQFAISDPEFVQLICALRLSFPQVGIVLSTRESAALRDALFPLGITSISAGSHTEPGGYTGEGREDLHLTVRGRRVELDERPDQSCATGQFDISDHRSPSQIAERLRSEGFDPVWKDWDHAIIQEPALAVAP
ncbi:MAG: 2-iminoacetate synthase ThiH [Verrucomicrobiae bacterium]|nr:2-iminoacetate synthase ThiH [Verrucomicrobiae bacterium]